jgi:hypothetical protein
MKIRKAGSLYQVGSKYYTKKDFIGLIFAYILGIILVLGIVGLIVWGVSDQMKANKIAASDDPVGNLILALKERPKWGAAIDKLDEIGDPLLISLAPACTGVAVGGSAYEPDKSGPHPLVLLLPDGKSTTGTYTYLDLWGPITRQPEDVQLVVCADAYEAKLQGCSYGVANRTRIQHRLTLNVIEASTGKILETKTFIGSEPAKCPSSVSQPGNKTYEGDPVDYTEVREYLQDLYD